MNRADLLSIVVRFWSKVDRSGDCWLWTGQVNNQGYGRLDLWTDNKHERVLSHRLAYAFFSGEDVTGLVIRHDCDTPRCCNPAHLRTGTQADNMRDAVERNRANLDGLAAYRQLRDERVAERIADGTKTCSTCEQVKSLDDFHRARASVDGRQGRCKECRAQALRGAWRNDPAFRESEIARKRAGRVAKPPRTHCGNEHELTPENVGPRGQCKRCAVERARRAYQRKKQAKAEVELAETA